MLILFDVDATLITTHRSGVKAMGLAGRALFGADFDESRVEYAGRLDPLIIGDLLRAHGREATRAGIEEFRRAYADHLPAMLIGTAKPCPGVMDLLGALEGLDDAPTLGLLTGNYPETGAVKLRAAGIDPGRFAVHVWGCDSPHDPPARSHLPPVGLARYRTTLGRDLHPSRAVIIGDTPHDISCAHDNGMRAIGVATGLHSRAELERCGADLALDTLSDTDRVVRWITG